MKLKVKKKDDMSDEKYEGPVPIAEVQLKKIPLNFQHTLPAVWQEGQLTVNLDEVLQHIFVRLESFVWAEPLKEEVVGVVFHTPATWWDMFRVQYSKFFPKWFHDRYPIKLRTQERKIRIETVAAFPQFCYAHPEQKFVLKKIISEVH